MGLMGYFRPCCCSILRPHAKSWPFKGISEAGDGRGAHFNNFYNFSVADKFQFKCRRCSKSFVPVISQLQKSRLLIEIGKMATSC